MDFIQTTIEDNIALLTMSRGKVHAFNEHFIDELTAAFRKMRDDDNVSGIVITGSGKFFSFGLDVPGLYDYPLDDFTLFVKKFLNLYKEMYLFEKPIVAALNGHTVAAGLIIALACDYRIMSGGKLALNEIALGASLFAGALDMLAETVGRHNAEKIALTGDMYSTEEAMQFGLIDEIADEKNLIGNSFKKVKAFAEPNLEAFTKIKHLLRKPVVDDWMKREEQSIEDFVKIWYSPEVREIISKVEIR